MTWHDVFDQRKADKIHRQYEIVNELFWNWNKDVESVVFVYLVVVVVVVVVVVYFRCNHDKVFHFRPMITIRHLVSCRSRWRRCRRRVHFPLRFRLMTKEHRDLRLPHPKGESPRLWRSQSLREPPKLLSRHLQTTLRIIYDQGCVMFTLCNQLIAGCEWH